MLHGVSPLALTETTVSIGVKVAEHKGSYTVGEPVCVYDTGCGVCTRLARWASQRSPVTFTGPIDLSSRGVDPVEYKEYVVYAGETVERGHKAIAAVLQTMRQPWALIGRIIGLRALSPVGAFVYRFVARNRSWLPF